MIDIPLSLRETFPAQGQLQGNRASTVGDLDRVTMDTAPEDQCSSQELDVHRAYVIGLHDTLVCLFILILIST